MLCNSRNYFAGLEVMNVINCDEVCKGGAEGTCSVGALRVGGTFWAAGNSVSSPVIKTCSL